MRLKKNINYILPIVLLLCMQGITAQIVAVKAKLDTFAIEIGDQIWLNLSVEQEKSQKVEFPAIKDTIIEGIDVLSKSSIDTQTLENSRIRVNQKFLISAFEDSVFFIPAFAFHHSGDTLYSNSLTLNVGPVRLDSAEIAKIDTSQTFKIFDIKGPINTPLTLKEFLQRFYPYILAIIMIALIVTLTIIYLKRRAKNKPFIKLPEKPKEPAHVVALRALDNLKAKKLWQSGQEKEYYLELTDIIREYIEGRFSIATFERTSYEILENINQQKILKIALFEQLKQTLTLADLAKFAKYKPLPNENDLCLKNSYHFVESTKLEQKLEKPIDSIDTETDTEEEILNEKA